MGTYFYSILHRTLALLPIALEPFLRPTDPPNLYHLLSYLLTAHNHVVS
jgi:hypothetical protein